MWPANWKSRGEFEMPLIVPNVVEPADQFVFGSLNVTLFQVFRQSTSKTNSVSRRPSGKLRRSPVSRFWFPGLRRFSAAVRGAFPRRYWAVLTGEAFCGVENALGSMY